MPFEENTSGQGTAFRRLKKMRLDKENLFGWNSLLRWGSTTRLGFRKNHAGTRNGVSPLGENASGQGTAFCHSWKTRRGKQRRFAVRGNRAGGSNGVLPFGENAFGQGTAFRRSRKMRRDGQRHFHLAQIAPGRGKPFWVEVAFALGKHHPRGFWAKSREVPHYLNRTWKLMAMK